MSNLAQHCALDRLSATCQCNGLSFEVEYECDPEIKGGFEEEPQPERFEILSAKYNGADFLEMLRDDVFEQFERQIKGENLIL